LKSSTSSSPPPSLEKPILQVARSSLRYIPKKIINALAILLRQLLKSNLKRYERFDVSICPFDNNIDIIEYIPQNQSKELSADCIIYINGGGFSLCDSADLLLSECLLPLIHERHQLLPPIIYCIHYPTLKSTNDITNYDIVKKQIYDSYNNIVNKSNKNIICIMGDSAGGNLVLQLLSQIKSSPPKIFLQI
jgi:acetyl esterase/lipase